LGGSPRAPKVLRRSCQSSRLSVPAGACARPPSAPSGLRPTGVALPRAGPGAGRCAARSARAEDVRKVLTTPGQRPDNGCCRRLLQGVSARQTDSSTRWRVSRTRQHAFTVPPDALHQRPTRPSSHLPVQVRVECSQSPTQRPAAPRSTARFRKESSVVLFHEPGRKVTMDNRLCRPARRLGPDGRCGTATGRVRHARP
jgi:hypothetical protein